MADPNLLPPVDETIRLPDNVMRAAAAAEAAHKAVYGEPEPTIPVATGDKAVAQKDDFVKIHDASPAPLPRVSTPSGEKILVPKTPVPPTVQPPQPDPEPAPPAPAPQPTLTLTPRDGAPKPDATDENDPAVWKQRFLSSQGRLEQAQRTLGMTQEQLQQMGDEVSRLNRAVTAPPQQEPLPQIQFSDKDKEALGEDFLNTVARVATQAVRPTVEAIRNTQRHNADTLQRTMQQTAARFVHGELDRAVPAWREINRSMEFAQWLSLPDIYSGVAKANLLKQAFAAGDASRVVSFFKGFVVDATGGNAVPVPAVAQTPVPRLDLATLAAPGSVKPATGSEVHLPPEKPIYTRSQISDFYSEVRRGLWANRPQDKAAIEADMISAGREGRVRG